MVRNAAFVGIVLVVLGGLAGGCASPSTCNPCSAPPPCDPCAPPPCPVPPVDPCAGGVDPENPCDWPNTMTPGSSQSAEDLFDAIQELADDALAAQQIAAEDHTRLTARIAVCRSPTFQHDGAQICAHRDLAYDRLVEIHQSATVLEPGVGVLDPRMVKARRKDWYTLADELDAFPLPAPPAD